MIEYTNLNPLPELGGDRILYVPQYLSADDPRYAQTDEEVLRAYTDALALINPAFDRRWVTLLRRVPRPLRPADLPHRLPDHDAFHPDAGPEPVPHRLLPAPSPRPDDQRLVRPGDRGGPARGARGSRSPMRPSLDGRTAAVLGGALVPPLAFVMTGRSSAADARGRGEHPRDRRRARRPGTRAARGRPRFRQRRHEHPRLVRDGPPVGRGGGAGPHGLRLRRGHAAGARVGRARRRRARHGAIARGAALGSGPGRARASHRRGGGPAPSLACPSLLDSLFSSRHGLFFWAPVLTIAVLGLALRAARGHRAALGALTALAVLALVNAEPAPLVERRLR